MQHTATTIIKVELRIQAHVHVHSHIVRECEILLECIRKFLQEKWVDMRQACECIQRECYVSDTSQMWARKNVHSNAQYEICVTHRCVHDCVLEIRMFQTTNVIRQIENEMVYM